MLVRLMSSSLDADGNRQVREGSARERMNVRVHDDGMHRTKTDSSNFLLQYHYRDVKREYDSKSNLHSRYRTT